MNQDSEYIHGTVGSVRSEWDSSGKLAIPNRQPPPHPLVVVSSFAAGKLYVNQHTQQSVGWRSVAMQTGDDLFPYFDEILEFRSSLSGETDRGCALMAAAYLSDQLERLLRTLFVADQPAIERLFEPLGPLGSFSARIEVSYACGLLPRSAYRDLHLIRKIRNDFGHVAKRLTFDEPGIAGRCQELHHSIREAEAPARAKFTNAVLGVCAVIHFFVGTTSHQCVPDGVLLDEHKKRQFREWGERFAAAILEHLGLTEDAREDNNDS